jgi:hypothetical protein
MQVSRFGATLPQACGEGKTPPADVVMKCLTKGRHWRVSVKIRHLAGPLSAWQGG